MSLKERLTRFFSVKRNAYLFTAGVVSVIAIGGGLAVYFISRGNPDTKIFSDEETQRILSEVIKNNPKGVVDIPDDSQGEYSGDTGGIQNVAGIRSEDKDILVAQDPDSPNTKAPIPVPEIPALGEIKPVEEQINSPDIDVYNYRHTETTYTSGNSYSVCYGNIDLVTNNKDSYYEFFDVDRSYYKFVSSDRTSDRLNGYYLGKYGNDINHYYNYKGGEFSAKLMFTINEGFSNEYRFEVPSYPVSYTVAEQVEMFFGPSAQITDVYEQNDITYYEITATYNVTCMDGYHTIIRIYTVESDTFQITERRDFLDSLESMDNLMYAMHVTSERSKVYREDIEDKFTFDYPADTREIDYSSYVYDPDVAYQLVLDYLISGSYDLLYPSLDDFELDFLYSKNFPEKVAGEKFYLDRGYYASDDEGQEEYDLLMDARNQMAVISSVYALQPDNSGQYDNMYVKIYESDRSAEDLINEATSYTAPENLELSTSEIVIDNVSVEVRKAVVSCYATYPWPISYPTSYPVSYPTSYPVSYPTSYGTYYTYKFVNTYIAFEAGDQTYILSHFGVVDGFLETYEYNIISADLVEQDELSDAIRYYYQYCCGWWY